jgi:hypothetical protein
MGSYNLPWEQEVVGSNPIAPIYQQLTATKNHSSPVSVQESEHYVSSCLLASYVNMLFHNANNSIDNDVS